MDNPVFARVQFTMTSGDKFFVYLEYEQKEDIIGYVEQIMDELENGKIIPCIDDLRRNHILINTANVETAKLISIETDDYFKSRSDFPVCPVNE